MELFFTMLVPLIIAAVALYGMARRVDVYDALVSERVYKKAFSHEKALEMIRNGECGTFNPLLLQCMTEAQDKLKTMMEVAENELKGVEKTE